MSENKTINLLVIPDLFPKNKEDVQGIFVLDYLKSVEFFCNIHVLVVKLVGEKKGLTTEQIGNTTIHRYCLSETKISAFLKPIYYIRWFIKGYQIGKTLQKPNIIHAHGTILSGTLSLLLSRNWKIPFVITEHQGPFSMISDSSGKEIGQNTSCKSNSVLTVSEHLKQEITNSNIHPKSIQVTYNPVDTNLFQLKPNREFKNILFVGRLDEFKGCLRCLKAFDQIHQEFPEHKFTIVGNGEEFLAIKNYLETNPHLKNKVVLKGQQTKHEIALEMQKADLLVFPSRHESFGLVITEALSCGLPVIVGNKTAPKEFVDKSSGLLVPSDDIPAIAESMKQIISNLSSYNSQSIRNTIITRFWF